MHLIRFATILLIWCTLPTQLRSQVKIGPRFGVGVSNFKESSRGVDFKELNLDYHPRINYHVGVSGAWELSHKLTLTTEVLLSKIGSNLKNVPPRLPLQQIQFYNYWSIPIGLRYLFSNGFILETGVNFGIYKISWWKFKSLTDSQVLQSFPNDKARFIKGIQLLAGWQLSDRSSLMIEVNPFGTFIFHRDDDWRRFTNLQLAFRYQPWSLTNGSKPENPDF
jgi:hypothetical protein